MGSNPINLGVRFLLELAALIIFGFWGWSMFDGGLRFVLAILFPVLAAILWGTFAVIDDPSRSGKAPIPVPGSIRLVLEILFFALAAIGFFQIGNENLAWIFTGAVVIHYLVSYDRVIWLLRQKTKNR